MDATLKRRIVVQDAAAAMQVLEMAVMYSYASPHSTDMLKKVVEDYKDKETALLEDHNKVLSTMDEELEKRNAQLGTNAQALAEKEDALRDLSL